MPQRSSLPTRPPESAVSTDRIGDQPADTLAFTGAVAPVAERVLAQPTDQQRFARSQAQFAEAGVRDFEFATDADNAQPQQVFDRLRWGGLLIFVSAQPREAEALLARYRNQPEWRIEHEPEAVVFPRFEKLDALHRLPLPTPLRRLLLERKAVYFTARKVLIDPVSRLTAKHSYDVSLVPAQGKADQRYATDGFVVLKRVPTLQQAVARLEQTCPGLPAARVEAIAGKLVRKIFPVFLTREAAFLKLLQRDLPPKLKIKTPRVLSMEADGNGLVRAMSMKWLRQGGEPISQTAFARQASELLRALHQQAGVMHLDLRLDNLLVTDDGVCIIDFGSSVRVGEDLSTTATTDTLIREMLAASQVTRDLERQRSKNLIRSDVFDGLPYPPSPAFDLFALATNMTRPHDNADFKGLVTHDRDSDEAQYFSRLRRRILKPTLDQVPIRSVHDLCVELGVPATDAPATKRPAEPSLRPVINQDVSPSTPRSASKPTSAPRHDIGTPETGVA